MSFLQQVVAPGGSTIVSALLHFNDGSSRTVAGVYLGSAHASAINPTWKRVMGSSGAALDALLASGAVLYFIQSFTGAGAATTPTGWWARFPTATSPANVQREASDFAWGMQQLAAGLPGGAGGGPSGGGPMVQGGAAAAPMPAPAPVVVVPLYQKPGFFLGLGTLVLLGGAYLLLSD